MPDLIVPEKAPAKGLFHKKAAEVKPSLDLSDKTHEVGKVIRAEGPQLNEKFSVLKETESTAALAVQELYQYFTEEKGTNLVNLESWQNNFVKMMKEKYPDLKDKNKQDKIAEYAADFVKTQFGEENGLVFAIRLMDWQLATFQRATGGYITEIQRPETVYRPQTETAGRGPSAKASIFDVLRRGPGRIPALSKLGEKIGNTFKPVEQKDKDYHYETTFPDGALNFDPANLDQGQKAYLQRLRKLNTGTTPGVRTVTGNDEGSFKDKIAVKIERISKARIDFYRAIGDKNIDLNTININNTAYTTRFNNEPYLRSEQRAKESLGARGNVNPDSGEVIKEDVKLTIDKIKKGIQIETSEKLKEGRTAKKEEQTVNVARNQINELGQTNTITEADQKRITDLEKIILKTESQVDLEKKHIETKKSLEQTKANRDSTVEIINHLDGDHKDLTKEYFDLPTKKNERDELIRRRDKGYEERKSLGASLSKDTSGRVQLRIDALNTEIDTKETRITQLNNEIILTENLVKSYGAESLFENLDKDKKDFLAKTTELNILDRNINLLVNEIQGIDPSVNRDNLLNKLEEKLKKDKADLEKLNNGTLGREKQKEVLTTYSEKITPKIDDINNRAHAPAKDLPLEYVSQYRQYPEVYLKAIQIIMGPESILPGGEKDFQEGSRLLTPEKLLEIVNNVRRKNGLTNYVDVLNIQLSDVNSRLIKEITNSFRTEVISGTLGKIPQLQIESLIKIKKTETNNTIVLNNPELDVINNTIFHYENIEDLSYKIAELYSLAYHVDVNTILNTENAIPMIKRYAEEIDRRRVDGWQKKIHATPTSTPTPVIPQEAPKTEEATPLPPAS